MTIELSLVIPCYNEEETLEACVERVLGLEKAISIEIVIVDDKSTDNSPEIARRLSGQYPNIKALFHEVNRGKGAALRTGFKHAKGNYIVVQDADLEYDPMEILKLLEPLRNNIADVVLGSRFLSGGAHRVLYYWHSLGNRFLTTLSNMFTDLNLTDMETCYKVFRRDVIDRIAIEEERFGFEPEIVSKIAQMRLRIYEIGISYYGRTYEEGKKISARDGFRALYCILHYNAHKAPIFLQLLVYLFVGGISAIVNLLLFIVFYKSGLGLVVSTLFAFYNAALCNYFLCIKLLYRHTAKWSKYAEIIIYLAAVSIIALIDFYLTKSFIMTGIQPILSKAIASFMQFVLNFILRKFVVFPEKGLGPWKPQRRSE
jgi:dolichol-phosphate mannosyltransferase